MACREALVRKTPRGLPAADYGVGGEAEWNSEHGQLGKDRPANYTQVKYTCSGASASKINALGYADVTKGLRWLRVDWNLASLEWRMLADGLLTQSSKPKAVKFNVSHIL